MGPEGSGMGGRGCGVEVGWFGCPGASLGWEPRGVQKHILERFLAHHMLPHSMKQGAKNQYVPLKNRTSNRSRGRFPDLLLLI